MNQTPTKKSGPYKLNKVGLMNQTPTKKSVKGFDAVYFQNLI
jgi:hypothetical protein